jgi:SAM-dependent methyltransferase
MPGREAVEAFLRRLNPVAYGSPGERPTPAQSSALDDAANGLGAMISSAAGPDGLLAQDACPLYWPDEDPRNVWALAGRLAARTRTVQLPLLGLSATLQQRWREDDIGDDECEIESHSTAAACWDGAVVLADLLCLPPPVLLAHSASMARSVASYAGWRWADKSVLELGCGIGALPALVTAFLGARRVLCTDGHASVLRMTRANIAQWVSEHPRVTPPVALRLLWGDGEYVRGQLRAAGLPEAPFDVILAADCLYVLENPGAWGKFLSTVVALSTPETLVFVTYTDRGHNALWERFVSQRVRRYFDVVAVGSHLLHPAAQPGAPGRLEHHHPACQVFCWALKAAASPTESE